MPKITRLPFITSGTTATSFLVVDSLATRRLLYSDFVDRVVSEIGAEEFTGPTGPAGPAGPPGSPGVSTVAGPTGPTGPSTLPIGGSTGQVLAKASGSNYDVTWTTVSGGGGGGVGLVTRGNAVGTATGVSAGASSTINIVGPKTYVLSKVTTSSRAWVRIYSDAASRTNDAARLEGTDPLPGSGVIAEVITTPGFLTQLITPGVVGFNNDTTVADVVYVSVKNTDLVTSDITVTLSLLQLEA
jgi:hypothetical protein